MKSGLNSGYLDERCVSRSLKGLSRRRSVQRRESINGVCESRNWKGEDRAGLCSALSRSLSFVFGLSLSSAVPSLVGFCHVAVGMATVALRSALQSGIESNLSTSDLENSREGLCRLEGVLFQK